MTPKILLQLDPDPQPSVFDAVVAVDAGVEQLFSRGNVTVDQVRGLVHGTIFTRSLQQLHRTAIFVGGSDVAAGERLLAEVNRSFFGPLRVSVMLDASGANTTAAAAVLAASRHLSLAGCRALVLAATGPVGQRVAQLLAQQQARVTVASRRLQRAEEVTARVTQRVARADVRPVAIGGEEDLVSALTGMQLVVAAGAAGIVLFPSSALAAVSQKAVVIDLNAVPPLGVPWIEPQDAATTREKVTVYGALGVGGLKMKIHKLCIGQLFERNDQTLDAAEILALGQQLDPDG